MTTPPSPAEIDAALHVLARLLAPHLAPLVKEIHEAGHPLQGSGEREYHERIAEQFVEGLPPDVIEGGLALFAALRSERHEIDSITLGDRTGLSTRELSGRIIRPLHQRARALGLKDPWTASRVAPSGDLGARTIWRADGNVAEMLYSAFKEKVPAPSAARGDAVLTGRADDTVLPSAVFLYAPEYARGLDEARAGWSSCLRTTEKGSRAIIYRAHTSQGIVALFDIEDSPEEDRDWGYVAPGYFTPVDPPIPRERLLNHPELEPIFRHIQGRRRLPPSAQEAIAELLENETKTTLPPHSLTHRTPRSSRRNQRR